MTSDRERVASRPDGDELPPVPESSDAPAVLVVDDGGEAAETLRTAGFEVTRATAEETPAAATDGEFDCAVVASADARSVSDGLQSATPAVPVVLVGEAATDAAAAFAAGADEFVAAENATEPAVLGARVRNVVARERAAELRADLARERGLLDAIFETVPAHLYVKDREARHVRVSEAYVPDTERFLGKTDYEVFPHEASRETYEDDVRVMETGDPLFDKEEPIVSSAAHQFSLRHLLEEHGDVETDTGDWALTSKVPWRDEDGEVVGLVGFTVDITEQKAVRRRLERQNERLAEFAGIVSHDLRSPLNVAQGYLELLEPFVEDETAATHLERVEQAHRRMDELVEDVLSLARQGDVVDSPEPTDVGDAAVGAWQTAVADATATLSVETDGLTVAADPGRLRELFDNLFVNAVAHGSAGDRTASDDGGVTVRVGSLAADDGFYVEDDGPGIAEDERESVFETGYTSDPEGTGFGLAIVTRIAEAHGWSVTLTDGDDGGARFEFRVDGAGDD